MENSWLKVYNKRLKTGNKWNTIHFKTLSFYLFLEKTSALLYHIPKLKQKELTDLRLNVYLIFFIGFLIVNE